MMLRRVVQGRRGRVGTSATPLHCCPPGNTPSLKKAESPELGGGRQCFQNVVLLLVKWGSWFSTQEACEPCGGHSPPPTIPPPPPVTQSTLMAPDTGTDLVLYKEHKINTTTSPSRSQ